MKVHIEYETKEKVRVSANAYSHKSKVIEVDPLCIFRHPCGTGAAQKRYTYSAEALAPVDAAFTYGEENNRISGNINRKMNKHFNPKKLTFVGNRAKL